LKPCLPRVLSLEKIDHAGMDVGSLQAPVEAWRMEVDEDWLTLLFEKLVCFFGK